MSRRPLFTTGIPQVLPALASIIATPDSALSLLDLRSLNTEQQSYTRFLTLYVANQTDLSGDLVDIAWREGTGTPVFIGEAALDAGFTVGGPVKILDRFPVRGNVQVIASAAVGDAPVVWGYFEFGGVEDPNANIRPLQPGPLVSPFTYEPVVVEQDADPEPVHLLDADYFDLVTLDVAPSSAEGPLSVITVFDGSDSTSIQVRGDGSSVNVRLFDGIPMMAAASFTGTPALLASSTNGNVTAWGYFNRVS